MIPSEVYRMYNILTSFLGESKSGLDETYQLQFLCPNCVKNKGREGRTKFNLEVSLSKNIFNCWSCSNEGEDMHGTVFKLIRKFGNKGLLDDYKECLRSIKNNKLYELSVDLKEFTTINDEDSLFDEMTLPEGYMHLSGSSQCSEAVNYLLKRGIGSDIIDKFKLGLIPDTFGDRMMKNRIVLPSFNCKGFINYWTCRDYRDEKWRPKYKNPKVERNTVIFNESHIDWDADITLVEGPFDSLVYPNMIPLLGKKITSEFAVYKALQERANANVNIFLDADAFDAVKALYKLLNTGNLLGRVRYIPVSDDLDPSKIYELWGKQGIIDHMRGAKQFNELYLNT